MSVLDPLWNARYWSDRLMETEAEAKPLQEKLYQIPITLTIEDQIKIRSVLEAYGSYTRLLHEDMTKPAPKPVPLWKKLFKR